MESKFLSLISEDCTDCFAAQKKDEPNDKDKKEEEEASTSVHHSIIETWDWGRQPGESRLGKCGAEAPCQPAFIFYASCFPNGVINMGSNSRRLHNT